MLVDCEGRLCRSEPLIFIPQSSPRFTQVQIFVKTKDVLENNFDTDAAKFCLVISVCLGAY